MLLTGYAVGFGSGILNLITQVGKPYMSTTMKKMLETQYMNSIIIKGTRNKIAGTFVKFLPEITFYKCLILYITGCPLFCKPFLKLYFLRTVQIKR